MTQNISVLFVCLGNICRSPTAHGALRDKIAAARLSEIVRVDSAGTGSWHVGASPDSRAQQTARAQGVSIDDLRARQVVAADLTRFDYVIAMDHANYADLCGVARKNGLAFDRVSLLTDWASDGQSDGVPDPYAGGPDGFERVFDTIETCTDAVMRKIQGDLAAG